MSKRVSFLAAGVAVMASVAAAWGQDYAVRFSRPAKVGERTKCVITEETTTTTAVSKPQVNQTSTRKVEVEAVGKILAVTETGSATRVEYTIVRFKGAIDGKAAPDVPAGTVVEASRPGGKSLIRSKGAPLPEEVVELLEKALGLGDPNPPGDDETFGTSQRKRIGEPWNVNAGVMAKDLTKKGVRVTKDDITGSVAIQKVHDVGGEPCLRIAGEAKINNVRLPSMHPESKVSRAVVEVKIRGDFPVDPAQGTRVKEMTMTMNIELDRPAGADTSHISLSMNTMKHEEYTPLPAEAK